MGNLFKTALLLGVLTSVLVLLGGALGGQHGMLLALVMAAVMNFGAYWFSDKLALAMSGARPIDESQAPQLYGMVRNLATRAQLPMPRVYMIPEDAPNAFATGRNPEHASVAVTQGLLDRLNRVELEGVLAHELAHVKNRDMLVNTLAATLVGVVVLLAGWMRWGLFWGGGRGRDRGGGGGGAFPILIVIGILAAILAPLAAQLIRFAVSRRREYQADATGARIAGRPSGLASALEKMEMAAGMARMQPAPATAHLYIVNPLTGGGLASLFSTHPPIQERVARLRAMATV